MAAPSPRPIAAIRLDGGRLCIDFVNTIHDRFAAIAEDYLATPGRYEEWARRAGALDPGEEILLPRPGEETARLMSDIRGLRDALHVLLTAWIDNIAFPADALRTANDWLLCARSDQVLASDGQLLLSGRRGDALVPLKRVALDLVDTLAMAREGAFKLERCANHGSCGWLFADTSKNKQRRWCSMQTCGAISKMAALRQRSAMAHPAGAS